MRYLDASIPLGIMIAEPKEKLNDLREIMNAIETGGEKAATSTFTLAEIVYVLERENKQKRMIKELILDFMNCSGLSVVDVEVGKCNDALETYEKYDIDFIDAHHIAMMNDIGIKEIYSLDPHFDRIKGIIRLEKLYPL